MALRVTFELGHEASIRTKKTHEGFTHDWEVFLRGEDNADISQFIDKVIFILHDTFIKPRRVIKDPPYVVRESGYAGFNFPIEVHLKNREEPKVIIYNYDLQLQPSGPTINKLRRERYTFSNPNDDFKRKLLKGGAVPVSSSSYFSSNDHDRKDFFPDERSSQLIGKPKLGGDNIKKHKQKDYRIEESQRNSNPFKSLFDSPIHKISTPDPKKPSPNSKFDKKEKDKLKLKHESKEHREDKKKEDKFQDDKKMKSHKVKDSKDVKLKRPSEKPPSPPPAKRPLVSAQSPRHINSPNNKSNSSISNKDESKATKHFNSDIKSNTLKITDPNLAKQDKKVKKVKKSHEKEREMKKDQKERETKVPEPVKEKPKESIVKSAEKKPAKPLNKFSIEYMLKDPADSVKFAEMKHKDKSELEKKHKHKKKDKKREESKEKIKDSSSKEKKHKHDKHKEKTLAVKEVPDKVEPVVREDKVKEFKEKERSQFTNSPISLDTSSQSSSKSGFKSSANSKKNPLGEMIAALTDCSSDTSIISDDEDTFNRSTKPAKPVEPVKVEKVVPELPKSDKPEKSEKSSSSSSHKAPKKEKVKEAKEEKQRKRKSNSKDESDNSKSAKLSDDAEHKIKKTEHAETSQKSKPDSTRSKSDTKVQDDGVSSSYCENPPKCETPSIEEEALTNEITPDYMIQLQELQHRIMTIQSNDELERVVNLIAGTGKFEVTKKTFDFDLCSLDRTTVQRLQEMIGCESRA